MAVDLKEREVELVIIRGLPGSGKSTFARVYGPSKFTHIENDMFFIDDDGNYKYDDNLKDDAAEWTQEMVRDFLSAGKSCIVSNTFTTKERIEQYSKGIVEEINNDADLLVHVKLSVICMKNDFGSIHNVPKFVIEKMQGEWESWDGESFVTLDEVKTAW